MLDWEATVYDACERLHGLDAQILFNSVACENPDGSLSIFVDPAAVRIAGRRIVSYASEATVNRIAAALGREVTINLALAPLKTSPAKTILSDVQKALQAPDPRN